MRGKQWALNHDSCSGIQVTEDSYSQICAVAQVRYVVAKPVPLVLQSVLVASKDMCAVR